MHVLGFGTYDTRTHPRAGILLTGLQRRGVDVEELSLPLGLTTAERVAMLGSPWQVGRLLARMARRWGSLIRRRYAVRPPDAVLVGYLGQFDVLLARALFPRTTVILDLLVLGADTASDRGMGSPGRLAVTGALDRLAAAAADIVVVDTAESGALVPRAAADRVVACPVGADDTWFAARRPRTATGGLSVVFFGLFTPLQGAPTIGQALRLLRPERDAGLMTVTMVGSGQDLHQTRERAGDGAGVSWLDWVDSADLPGLVAAHDVCLGIFGTTPKGLRVVPNKVFQGAAAGCAIVTSDTAPQRRSLSDAALFVPPGDAPALARALRSLAHDAVLTADLRNRAAERADAHFTPTAVAAPLAAALGQRHSTPQP